MSDATMTTGAPTGSAQRRGPDLNAKPHAFIGIILIGLLLVGIGFVVQGLLHDMSESGASPLATGVFILLGLALLIAFGFEFVNGFHDTANAVATVIYTHSLPAQYAVIWSGFFNFLGVLTSSGTVAFTVVSLLPVELILQVGTGAAPTAYALNHALDDKTTPAFMQATQQAEGVFNARANGETVPVDQARGVVTKALQDKSFDQSNMHAAMSSLAHDMGAQV